MAKAIALDSVIVINRKKLPRTNNVVINSDTGESYEIHAEIYSLKKFRVPRGKKIEIYTSGFGRYYPKWRGTIGSLSQKTSMEDGYIVTSLSITASHLEFDHPSQRLLDLVSKLPYDKIGVATKYLKGLMK